MEEYKKMLKNYAVFSGRSTRKDYWMAVLFNFVISALITVIGTVIKMSFLGTIYSLLVLIPGFAISFRRMHDINKSGAWILVGLIPIVGWIIWLVLLCQKSVDEDNRFGDIVE